MFEEDEYQPNRYTFFLISSGLPMLSPRTARNSASFLQASSNTLSFYRRFHYQSNTLKKMPTHNHTEKRERERLRPGRIIVETIMLPFSLLFTKLKQSTTSSSGSRALGVGCSRCRSTLGIEHRFMAVFRKHSTRTKWNLLKFTVWSNRFEEDSWIR